MSAPQASRIDPEKGWFIANGRKYYVQDVLTMGRLKHYKRLMHVLAFGATVEDHIKFVKFVIAQMSGPVTFLATHKILENAYNVEKSYTDFIHDETDPWFRFGALFINREGEDISAYDEKVVQSKINDWIKEGLDTNDFFLLCVRQEPILRVKYLKSLPGSLMPEKGE